MNRRLSWLSQLRLNPPDSPPESAGRFLQRTPLRRVGHIVWQKFSAELNSAPQLEQENILEPVEYDVSLPNFGSRQSTGTHADNPAPAPGPN